MRQKLGICLMLCTGFFLLPGCATFWNRQPQNQIAQTEIILQNSLPGNNSSVVATQAEKTPEKKTSEKISAPGQYLQIGNTPTPIEGQIPKEQPKPIVPADQKKLEVAIPVITGEKKDQVTESNPAANSANNAMTASMNQSIFQKPASKPDSPLLASLRAYEEGRSDFAVEQLRSFSPLNQALLAKILPIAAKSSALASIDRQRASELIDQFDQISDIIRPYTDLKIDCLLICSRVKAFADYTLVPGRVLAPGEKFVYYAEVSNAVPTIVTSSENETQYLIGLQTNVRIKGPSHSEISQLFKQTTSRNKKVYDLKMTLDAPKQPGHYTLELELTDTQNRKASKVIDFQVEERR